MSSALAPPRGMDASARTAEPARQSDRRVDDGKWLAQKCDASIWHKLAAVSGLGGQCCG